MKKLLASLILLIAIFAASSCNKDIPDDDVHTHTLTHNPAVAATCTSDGNAEHWICSTCNKAFSDADATSEASTVVIPKHGLIYNAKIDETCVSEGSLEFWHCNICNKNFDDENATNEISSVIIAKNEEHKIGDNGCCSVCSTDFTKELVFDKIEDGYSVIDYTGAPETIAIPTTYNGLPVTSIGLKAFLSCTSLKSVTIGDSVTEIGESAFASCTALKSVTIGCGVEEIPKEAFSSCASLENILISSSVTKIKEKAFYSCTSLKSITIPESITSVSSEAFSYCTSLDKVFVKDLAKWCAIFFNAPDSNPLTYAKKLYMVGSDTPITNLVIPEGAVSIGKYAFYSCSSIENVSIGGSVTSIGERAFYNCPSLKSVTISESVASINTSAFFECSSLEKVYISNLANWCGISFSNDDANPLTYAKKLYMVGSDTPITSFVIPEGVTTIRQYAFSGCNSIRSITIPKGITYIGTAALSGCETLKIINFCDTPERWNGIRNDDTAIRNGSYTINFNYTGQ